MLQQKMINFLKMTFAIIPMIIAFGAFASTTTSKETIYDSRIQWENEIARNKLLETVPLWDSVQPLFDAYLNPERYQLPRIEDHFKYNVQYINAFWGPTNNPFNKYMRPAKAFVFLDESSSHGSFYMAPLVKSSVDENYYVFDKNQSQPTLLSDWIDHIRSAQKTPIRFNICNGYGNLPTDSCDGKSYQDETADINDELTNSDITLKISSAHRDIHEDWRVKIKTISKSTPDSIYSESISWDDIVARNALLTTVVTWPNYQVIKNNFEKMRDLRYFQEENNAHFLRRISWLLPDDGCWTRTSAVMKDLFGPFNNIVNAYSRPSKLFAFGNLCVNTPNSPTGSVSWWYHTVPIVRDAETNQSYVLDPAVNSFTPLTIEQWMAEISSKTGACAFSDSKIETFNVCNGYGAGPSDSCKDPNKVDYTTEVFAMQLQRPFRYFERERQVELGREADKVLGDQPPWLNTPE